MQVLSMITTRIYTGKGRYQYKYGWNFSFLKSILVEGGNNAPFQKLRLSSYDIECIQRAKDFIDSDMRHHHTISEIAEYALINSSKLRTGFKELFGLGLFHYLKEQRLQKGKYLLENTEKSLKEISHLLGYKYPFNFNTAFKKRFGRPPGWYRK
jgi:AraC-like DNA-binding protein